ncbi:MAG: GAF domain-containing sensor histidine kinase [Actinomycetia bacterium]|nr:GAF domain-containing sensor histidine kinase [Actinomycetes bacterium]
MTRDRVLGQLDNQRLEIAARAAALALIYTVTVLIGTADDLLLQLILLTLLAIAAVLPVRSRALRRWRPAVEALVAGLIIGSVEPYDSSLLPYLVTPALSAGLIGGWSLAIITSGATIGVLLAPGAFGSVSLVGTDYLVDVVQWSLLALAVGLLAAWVRRVQTQVPGDDESYLEATRLLTQLRDVARELSGGLDAVSLGTTLIDDLRERHGVTRGWVFSYRAGSVPLALATGPGADFELVADLAHGTPWARAIDQGQAIAAPGALTSDPSMYGAVVPMSIRGTVVGLVAVERRGQPWTADELVQLSEAADADAVRLEAALLFDEVRSLATAEERQRLAREIHDGVAQEVASLGYLIDDISAHAPPEVTPQLVVLRDEVSRIISELRFSIFDLRREIGPGASLTSVLADHARHVGATAGIAVHLELSESPARLRPAIESEILRIAQEAIANARRHSRARNLWVTCLVDAPEVYLRVDDDGRGLLPPRDDSFGLSIMQERAERAGCELSVNDRPGGGTSVEVHQGKAGRHLAASPRPGRDSEHDDSRAAR